MSWKAETEAALAQEAAAWVARMARPDAADFRPQLERWLEADPTHRAAYARVQAHLDAARVLRVSTRFRERKEPDTWFRPSRIGGLVAASFGLALVASLSFLAVRGTSGGGSQEEGTIAPAGKSGAARQLLATGPGVIRTVALPDGSSLVLDTATRVRVAFGPETRNLVLEEGRARFSVAHERRPFIVQAGRNLIIARGTVFDVAFGDGRRVEVALLRGRIDVQHMRTGSTHTPLVTTSTLRAGEQIALTDGQVRAGIVPLQRDDIAWPTGMVDCDAVRLDQLLPRANRYAARPLVLADPSLGALTVSGRVRIADPDGLADNLARLLSMEVDRSDPSVILLRRPSQNNFPAS